MGARITPPCSYRRPIRPFVTLSSPHYCGLAAVLPAVSFRAERGILAGFPEWHSPLQTKFSLANPILVRTDRRPIRRLGRRRQVDFLRIFLKLLDLPQGECPMSLVGH